jgi:hypothetical protein
MGKSKQQDLTSGGSIRRCRDHGAALMRLVRPSRRERRLTPGHVVRHPSSFKFPDWQAGRDFFCKIAMY